MKNSAYSKLKAFAWPTKTTRILFIATFLLLSTQLSVLHAQASLSIQGILKKSNGVAVEDGTYNLTFKLYTVQSGGTALWTETQSGIEVTSGIYSTILGNSTALNIPFNQLYYLGVTIGSSELTPRIQLTSAPYALSLIGATNQFPSSGQVLADSIKVIGSVLARGGAPGLNGANRNGFAFSGNSGDKDSGLFSTADGKVALYSNNTEVLAVTPANVAVTGAAAVSGNVSAANLTLPNGGKVTYNGLSDWRLVVDDNLTGGANGWNVYNPLGGQEMGWNNSASAGAAPIDGNSSNFAGLYMYPANYRQVLKKFYDLSGVGAFSYIKVKFKYYFIDTWGFSNSDRGWAAFADGSNGSQMRLGWSELGSYLLNTNWMTTPGFGEANNFEGNNSANNADYCLNGEMTTFKNGNNFWLYFGGTFDEDQNNESWAVGMIEIWVR
ncbi:MAG: hypothetical protein ABJB16_16215 [Saprospiraceae bacterium]